jgi:superfamily II RNA helicase
MPELDPSSVVDPSSSSSVLDAFLEYLIEAGFDLYDHQEEAILELYEGKNVILNTPTGSGKSLVALALQFRAVCQGRRSYYTVPIKALANEKFLSLCKTFGPEKVGMITGDATVNPQAPVICCTAEILANLALREGALADVDDVIMDEFHYYSDEERGVAWQIPLLTLPQARFLLMSATLGETSFFEKALTDLTKAPTVLVQSDERPVPLEFDYSLTPLEEMVEELVERDRAPIYLVHFTQLSCARTAQNLMSRNFCSKEEKGLISEALEGADFRSPYGKEMKKLLKHGLGIHHAGLLPKYRVLVERLAQRGLLKVICGTDTLGVGVNVPIRTVMLTQLFKFGGKSTKTLAVRDFRQISGRAGRRGFDNVGYVVAQAPEHVIDNMKAQAKAADKGKKSKAMMKKPPEKGFVSWDENTFRRLIDTPPEKLSSSFLIRHGMILNVLSRQDEDGCAELRRIIADSHGTPAKKSELRKRAFALFKGLVEGGVLKILPKAERTGPSKVALNVELQDDFTMNQALGLYLMDAITQLDKEATEYVLNVISLVEAILEDPTVILRKQVDKAKDELVAEMKREGIEYDERMERLEEVEHPKPGKDFIYNTYNEFLIGNPWAKEAGVRPKSVAREMFEEYHSFEEYVGIYKLERSEAVLLRHLSEVYKVLAQTVPPADKTELLEEAEAFFEEIVRGVDSSLIDEWERMRNPAYVPEEAKPVAKKAVPFTRQKSVFERAVKTAVFDYVKALARGEKEPMDGYFADHGSIRMDPEARNKKHFRADEIPGRRAWRVEQVLVDTEELNDWCVVFEVDLDACDAKEEVVMTLIGVGEISSAM